MEVGTDDLILLVAAAEDLAKEEFHNHGAVTRRKLEEWARLLPPALLHALLAGPPEESKGEGGD